MAPAEEAKKDADSKPAESKPQQMALEEDDEFEEFDTDTWDESATDPADARLWVDTWDDDDTGDDFTAKLRQELASK